MCANLFRNVDNQLTSNTVSQLSSKDTECSCSHSGWSLERLAAGVMQVLKQKCLNRYLKGNICICIDNFEMCVKETSFGLTLNSLL